MPRSPNMSLLLRVSDQTFVCIFLFQNVPVLSSAPRHQPKRTYNVQTVSRINVLDHVCITAKQPAAPTGQLHIQLKSRHL